MRDWKAIATMRWRRNIWGTPSGLLTLASGRLEGGARFQDALQLFTRLVNIGDAKSLACHPASTPPSAQRAGTGKGGVTVDTVRLSVGIEHIDDLLADLDQALAAV
jgi:O-acetylhomoserine (thiol)-lyase